MNKVELLNDLKARIGPSSGIDDSLLTGWLNEAYMYIVDQITDVNPNYFIKDTTTPISGFSEYDLPEDFNSLVKLEIHESGTWYTYSPLTDINSLNNISSGQSVYSFVNPKYVIYKDQMILRPWPTDTTNGIIKMWYVYTPADMLADSDTPDLPRNFHRLISLGAYANYRDRDENDSGAEYISRRFERRVEDAVDSLGELQIQESKSIQIIQGQDMFATRDDEQI